MPATDDDDGYSEFIKLGTLKSMTRFEAAQLQLRRVVADNAFDDATHAVMTEFTEALLALLEAQKATAGAWHRDQVAREIENQVNVVPKSRLIARYVNLHPWWYIAAIIAAAAVLGSIGTLAGILGGT